MGQAITPKPQILPRNPDASPASQRLEQTIHILMGQVDLSPPRNRQIFVNRHLRLDRLEWIGFDMDYTLLRYHATPMETLIYNEGVKKLHQSGFSDDILQFNYDPERIVRGTIIDKEQGNIFIMDRHRHIGKAYHGHQPLTKEERKSYRTDRFSFKETDRFYLIDTLFSVPEACLYCDVVAWSEQQEHNQPIDYKQLFQQVRAAVDGAHIDNSIHNAIQADLSKYIHVDPEVALMLERFRSSGKRLFLLTNSDWGYTNAAMRYLLETTLQRELPWQEYFDLVIVRAGKPRFFNQQQPFEYLDAQGNTLGEGSIVGEHRYLRGGNLLGLCERIGNDDRVLYVGDHIYGDILRTKKDSTWRTMMICDEMEQELDQLDAVENELLQSDQLETKRNQLNGELNYHTMLLEQLQQMKLETSPSSNITLQEQLRSDAIQRAEQRIHELQQELKRIVHHIKELETNILQQFNPYWGMLFRIGHQNTYLGEQIRSYACIYSSRVTNFLYHSPTQYFRNPRVPLPHESHETQLKPTQS